MIETMLTGESLYKVLEHSVFVLGNDQRGLINGCINHICSGGHLSVPLVFKFDIKSSALRGEDYNRINLELIVICGQYLNLCLKRWYLQSMFFICPFEMTMTPNLNLTFMFEIEKRANYTITGQSITVLTYSDS